MTTVHHRRAAADGRQLFNRKVGPAGAPAAMLLHGFLASWVVFCELVTR